DVSGGRGKLQLVEQLHLLAETTHTRHVKTADQDQVSGVGKGGQRMSPQPRSSIDHHIAKLGLEESDDGRNVVSGHFISLSRRFHAAENVQAGVVLRQEGLESHDVVYGGAVHHIAKCVVRVEVQRGCYITELDIEVDQDGPLRRLV